jgi:hypothetical protein
MKKLVTAALLGVLLLFGSAAHSQNTPATVNYSERVIAEEVTSNALYQRALSWAEGQFPYTPKSDLQAKKETLEVRLTGTSKIKTAAANASGSDQERVLRFDFVFRATQQGYIYSVDNFRIVTDAKEPAVTVALNSYIQQLSQERTNARTHNDRRVTAQATAVASDVAAAFRSYMNTQPVMKDGEVGLADDNDGW